MKEKTPAKPWQRLTAWSTTAEANLADQCGIPLPLSSQSGSIPAVLDSVIGCPLLCAY